MSERNATGPADRTAVLLMGYGSPRGPDDLREYLADVLHRPPSDAMVEEYRRRYALIGGSPQRRILDSLRAKLARRFAGDGSGLPVYLGAKHGTPNVAEVVPTIVRDGFDRIVAIPLSPYASTWILEPYRSGLDRGRAASPRPPTIDLRTGWHLDPSFVGYWSGAIRSELAHDADPSTVVLLSAHSLPERYARMGDPYPGILAETSSAIARTAALPRWKFTYQSAGNTTEPWLGPDITERIDEAKAAGASTVLVASFGFVFDHLEVLYDLDIVIRQFAEGRGVRYRRVPTPNDADELVEALVHVADRTSAPPAHAG